VDTFFYDYAVNISHCGVYIKTDSPLPIGSRVLLNFSIPGTNREIKTEGKVVRSISEKHHSNKMEPLGMGIEFDPLKEEDVALIKTLWEESTQP
jgi:type IV pilus assembly protein PilZ